MDDPIEQVPKAPTERGPTFEAVMTSRGTVEKQKPSPSLNVDLDVEDDLCIIDF